MAATNLIKFESLPIFENALLKLKMKFSSHSGVWPVDQLLKYSVTHNQHRVTERSTSSKTTLRGECLVSLSLGQLGTPQEPGVHRSTPGSSYTPRERKEIIGEDN